MHFSYGNVFLSYANVLYIYTKLGLQVGLPHGSEPT